MRNISDYINEKLSLGELEDKIDKIEKKADKAEKEAKKAEETIKNEEEFRDYAENKFKEVFGDKLDKDKMNETIDGILKDNKEAVDNGDWGELVGKLNKSFGK